jgi:hypothetical protein
MRIERLGLGKRVWRILRAGFLTNDDQETRKIMAGDGAAEEHAVHDAIHIVRLQSEAWAAWNTSYHDPLPDAYRTVGLALYQQAIGVRIQALFARSDEQNTRLDELLRSRMGTESMRAMPHPWHTDVGQPGQVHGSSSIDRIRGCAA